MLRDSGRDAARSFTAAFGDPPAAEAWAPGRVNLLGEHTDYNGGYVLPAALELRTHVALRLRGDARVLGASRERGAAGADLAAPPDGSWLDYARGTARVLAEVGRLPASGFELAVASDVPEGAGLSSSAALEVACALALASAAGTPIRDAERPALAGWCQRAEHEYAGVPCGIMDQYTSACAREGHALFLRCRDLACEPVPIPPGLALLVADSGVRRELRHGGYAERLAECAGALEAARAALGRPLGSLSDVAPEELARLAPSLEAIPFRRLRHVVRENQRVQAFVAALRARDLAAAGALLYASHASLADDYQVSCAESDALVELSRPIRGVVGARMTGAGWGGCTIHLVEAARAADCAAALAGGFRARFGREPRCWISRAGPAAALRAR
jgi:galactokinase